eukprot:390084-Prorocentrum_lima.AAC.1
MVNTNLSTGSQMRDVGRRILAHLTCGTAWDTRHGRVLPGTPEDAKSVPPKCSERDVALCRQYTIRNVYHLGRPYGQ